MIAFEVAARLQSITRAARELRVTREAVSRQVRLLEQSVGIGLFERSSRSITLTPAGKELFAVISPALENIARCAEILRNIEIPARVNVTATVAISAFWLTPRLRKFCRAHPNIDLRVRASDTYRDLTEQGVDIGIWYGDGEWPGVKARHLFDITSFPICSPAYLKEHPDLAHPGALLNHPLLHLEGTQHSMEDWDWWLSGLNLPRPGRRRYIGFDSYSNVVQATVNGQGVALGYSTIVQSLLDRGDVVRPMDVSRSKGLAVYLVTPATARMAAETKAFVDWIVSEARVN
ncbi:MAG: LysR substrate-binding domain-containing protein [Pseudorhodoplanes sp.]